MVKKNGNLTAVKPVRAEFTPEFILQRVFDTPREILWKAWTDPEVVKQWWGPKGYSAPVVKMDVRVGGKYLNAMRGPDGKDVWSAGIYREVVPPERIVVTDSFADEKGNIVPASFYGLSPDNAMEMVGTFLFEEYEKVRTKLTLRYLGLAAAEMDGARQGWNQQFDKLDELLADYNPTVFIANPGEDHIVITRYFKAPRKLIHRAYVDPDLYVQWLGPRGMKMTLQEFKPEFGGSWRYIHTDPSGQEFRFRGVYHEVSPEMMIDTFEYEGLPEKGHVSMEIARFEEMPDGRTKFRAQVIFSSAADRDAMLQSGMEKGMSESFERLDELLAGIGPIPEQEEY
ncbi:MAG TPA: SRPBCC domain-containing protein [Dehalococcoidales bacterium]|nr:SRPBCC domain-containing protein [Dehalococcoidales bacterium]